LKNKETRTLENSNKHIDNWLSQQFEDFTPNPEPTLWQSIDATLDRKERQQKFIWYWLVAGVLLLVVAASLARWSKAKPVQISKIQSNVYVQTNPETQSNSEVQSNSNIKSNSNSQSNLHLDASSNSSKSSPSQKQYRVSKKPSVTSLSPIQANGNNTPGPVGNLAENAADENPAMINLNPFGIESTEIGDVANPNAVIPASTEILTWSVTKKLDKLLGRWLIEAGVDANQTGLMYRSTAALSNYVHKNYFNHMRDGEFALSAGRINVSAVYQISKNHALKLGVAYAENRTLQRFDFRDSMPATVMPGNKPDALGYYPIFGYLGLGPQVKFNSQTTYSMISVPFGYVGYFPLNKQYLITPEILLQANKLSLSAGAQTLDYQTLLQTAQQSTNFRKLIWGARLAMGVEKRLSYSHSIGLRFNAQSMLTSMYVPNAALQPRGWSLGLSAHYSK
jgi:hypothetical protein